MEKLLWIHFQDEILFFTWYYGCYWIYENDKGRYFRTFSSFPMATSLTNPRQIFPPMTLRVIFQGQRLHHIRYAYLSYQLSSLKLGTKRYLVITMIKAGN